MSLYNIIKSLQSAQGSKAKQSILDANREDSLLREYMKAVYDPAISYYQTRVPGGGQGNLGADLSQDTLNGVKYHLADRTLTGERAKNWLSNLNANLSPNGQRLLMNLLNRSIGAGIGETMVLKTWPALFFVPPYMRCSLMDNKAIAHFESIPVKIIQKKADGTYCSLLSDYHGESKAITRSGSLFPKWFVSKLLKGHTQSDVFLGELLVYKNGNLLDRKTGNGICNSVLKGADQSEFSEYLFEMEVWDLLTHKEFKAGVSTRNYESRLLRLNSTIDMSDAENIRVIETYNVKTMEEVFAINNKFVQEGFEGSVVKDPSGIWKNHTSPHNVKLKVAFEVDLEVVSVQEGTGKYVGKMGALNCRSRDGILVTAVGTGFCDADREQDDWENSIITVKANDIISNRDNDTKSLFLPVYVERRLDKRCADSYNRCLEQLNAARGVV